MTAATLLSLQTHLPLRQAHAQHLTRLCATNGVSVIVRARRRRRVARRHAAEVHDRSPVGVHGVPLWQALKVRRPTQRECEGVALSVVGRDRPRCTPQWQVAAAQEWGRDGREGAGAVTLSGKRATRADESDRAALTTATLPPALVTRRQCKQYRLQFIQEMKRVGSGGFSIRHTRTDRMKEKQHRCARTYTSHTRAAG